jgi:hypothetical protein
MPVTVTTNKTLSSYESTSTSSFTISNAAMTAVALTIETGKSWLAGDDIGLVPTAAKIKTMLIGTVTSYDSGTGALVANCTRYETTICTWDRVSSSTHTIGTGSKTFQTYNGQSALIAAADNIVISRRGANAANRMSGTVTSYDNATGTLVFNSTATSGSGSSLRDWIIVSGGTFAAWNIVIPPTAVLDVSAGATFTIDKEPLYPNGAYQCTSEGRILINNTSTSDLWVFQYGSRLTNAQSMLTSQGNGMIEITGNWIEIGTGTGLSGQTIDLSAYTKLDDPNIEIETGNGTGVYRPWYVHECDCYDRQANIANNYYSRGFNAHFRAQSTATVTMTTASPTVITWNSHGLRPGQRVSFTTTGTFTGITAGSYYYIIPLNFTANTFSIALSMSLSTSAPINVTAQSGTHTCIAYANFSSGLHGNHLLWNPATKILTCGNGTQGNLIPSGAKIRMPNIHLTAIMSSTPIQSAISSATAATSVTFDVGNGTNLTAAASTIYYINGEEWTGTVASQTFTGVTRGGSGTAQANHAQGDTLVYFAIVSHRSRLYITAGGKVVLSKVGHSAHFYLETAGPQECTMTDVFTYGFFSFSSSLYPSNFLRITCNPLKGFDQSPIMSSNLGALSLKKFYVYTSNNTTTGAIFSFISNSNVVDFEDIEVLNYSRVTGTASGGLDANTSIFNCVPKRITSIGGRLVFRSCNNLEVEDIILSGQLNALPTTQYALQGIAVVSCTNMIIRNVRQETPVCAHGSQLYTTDANCRNIVLHDAIYDATAMISAVHSGGGTDITVANVLINGTMRDATAVLLGGGASLQQTNSNGVIFRNVIFTPGDAYGADNGNGWAFGAYLEQTSGHSMLWRAATAANANLAECGPFHVLLDPAVKNAGVLYMHPSIKITRDIADLTGTAYQGNNGYSYLPTIGDTIIYKSYYNVRTITAFTGTVTPEVDALADLSYDFELVGPEDSFANSWTALTTANLNTAIGNISGFSDVKGFRIQVRITANATLTTNRLINLRMFTTNNAATVLPIKEVDYTLASLAANTTVAVFDGSTELKYSTGKSGNFTTGLQYGYAGVDETLEMKVRSYAATWWDHTVTYDQYPLVSVSLQVADTNITESNMATVAAYTDLDTLEKIYDYVKYWGTLRANLNIPQLCTKSGSTLNFGSYDIEFDGNASIPLEKVGNKIIIKGSIA